MRQECRNVFPAHVVEPQKDTSEMVPVPSELWTRHADYFAECTVSRAFAMEVPRFFCPFLGVDIYTHKVLVKLLSITFLVAIAMSNLYLPRFLGWSYLLRLAKPTLGLQRG